MERPKWNLTGEITAVIFVCALTEYNQVLREDVKQNRLKESINLFDIACNRRYPEKPIILFLNKKDLFEEQIKKVDLNVCFPTYKGCASIVSGSFAYFSTSLPYRWQGCEICVGFHKMEIQEHGERQGQGDLHQGDDSDGSEEHGTHPKQCLRDCLAAKFIAERLQLNSWYADVAQWQSSNFGFTSGHQGISVQRDGCGIAEQTNQEKERRACVCYCF